MKKILGILCLAMALTDLFGQSRNDFTWVLGYPTLIPGEPNNADYGGMYMKFDEQGGYRIEQFDIFGGFALAVANDASGNLLFHTNGCTIYNKEHQIMENGEDINIGALDYDENCNDYLGLFYIRSGTMTLPLPNSNTKQFLLHLRLIETSDTNSNDLLNDRLQFTEIDVQSNNGLGKVLQKNQVLVADSLHDAISAVRHGNGRDWWVVIPRGRNSQFWKILLTPEGFQEPELQTIPPPYPPFNVKYKYDIDTPPYYAEWVPDEYGHECWAGQATFSPDGTKYCRVLKSSGVEIYDFDRCTGEMVFRRYIPIPPYISYPEIPLLACGLAVSPNSRYLYFNNNEALYQFDMCEENLTYGDYELIEEWDRFLEEDYYATNFFQMRNAPDGKIYMNTGNSAKSLHVIHEPDKAGKNCRFEQRGAKLPRWCYFVINYFPNYRLYDLADSPCDTLGINDPHPPVKYDFDEFVIFPNPANREAKVWLPECEGAILKIWNVAGQLIKDETFVPGKEGYSINVSNWPAGPYIIAIYSNNQKPIVKRLIVSH